jgi:hypothetical protein
VHRLAAAPGPRARAATATEAARVFARGRDSDRAAQALALPGWAPGYKGRITGCEEGRALAFADDPGWAELRRLRPLFAAGARPGAAARGAGWHGGELLGTLAPHAGGRWPAAGGGGADALA